MSGLAVATVLAFAGSAVLILGSHAAAQAAARRLDRWRHPRRRGAHR